MDWNKTNTILITAFLILNIFLFVSSGNMIRADYNPNKDKEFAQEVSNLLDEKNIKINAEIPAETYTLPVLDTEYEIIHIDSQLLENFLHEKIEPLEDVYTYSNKKGEILEVIDGKKLRLELRSGVPGKIDGDLNIREKIENFIKDYNIDAGGYAENLKHISENRCNYIYTKRYNDYSVENSYMKFFADKEGIYKFE
ncbi:MAG TPA: hypothetical protein PLL21_00970, partial [Sedimentibacter sp.]|nr:hypothetical protein [Sedimentibacter sp.]